MRERRQVHPGRTRAARSVARRPRAVVALLALALIVIAAGGGAGARAQARTAQFSDLDVPEVPVAPRKEQQKEQPAVKARAGSAGGVVVGSGVAGARGGLLKPEAFSRGRIGPGAAMSAGGADSSLAGYSTGSRDLDEMIVEAGMRNGVDPLLILAVMGQESSYRATAVSPKGARGLMQLMPGTAARFGVRNIFDARENIEGGTKYLRWLLDYFGGDLSLSLAGYNAGESNVERYGRQVPPFAETREYVRRIGTRYVQLRGPAGR